MLVILTATINNAGFCKDLGQLWKNVLLIKELKQNTETWEMK
jgi:hypothetical protein